MSAPVFAVGFVACACAALAGAFAAGARIAYRQRYQRREAAYGPQVTRRRLGALGSKDGLGLRYAKDLTRRIHAKTTTPICPGVRAGKAQSTRAGIWFQEHRGFAGCSREISAAGYCEARMRLGLAGVSLGIVLGLMLSVELGVVLGAVFGASAGSAPRRALRAASRRRAACAQRHLSEMLEVVSLGLRSGLTFDRSFALYGSHFDNALARSCAKAYRSWSLGLVSREEALRELAGSYDCEQLGRIVDSVVRSLRFGTSLAGILEEAAAQSRAEYRSALEERVAKAPVKMMLPTGTLILPAMLLLVMGPILLELAGGF